MTEVECSKSIKLAISNHHLYITSMTSIYMREQKDDSLEHFRTVSIRECMIFSREWILKVFDYSMQYGQKPFPVKLKDGELRMALFDLSNIYSFINHKGINIILSW